MNTPGAWRGCTRRSARKNHTHFALGGCDLVAHIALSMNVSAIFRISSLCAIASLLSACASVSVRDDSPSKSTKPNAAPKHIYVVPFSTEHAKIKQHPMRKHPGELPSEAQKLLADRLVTELTKTIAPASLVSSPKAAGRDGWLVTGDFTELNEGSRILRMAIGLGIGSTKMSTAVRVQKLPSSNPPFFGFSTKGTSGATPGAATNPIPFSSAPTVLFQGQQGISDDSARTARMITARIANYIHDRGWSLKGPIPTVKMAR